MLTPHGRLSLGASCEVPYRWWSHACSLVLWWRPQWLGHLPRIMPLVAGRVSDNDVLLGLLLPGGSVAVVLLVTLCLRLGWRRGLEITEP